MNLAQVVKKNLVNIADESHNYELVRNKKRGQSYTYTILNSEKQPIYIAKFFDYVGLKKELIGLDNIKQCETIEELLDNINNINDIQSEIEGIIEHINFQKRCFTRYVKASSMEKFDCFPKVVFYLDEVKVNDSFYGLLIETFVDGETLEKKLSINGNETEIDVYDFLIQLATIVKKLKEFGIVHRDISPDNIIFFKNEYIVIDPGIIKMEDDSTDTHSNMRMGKCFYMAPEQYFWNTKHATFKSDLYSIGIIALEIVLGYNPLKKIMIEGKSATSPHEELLRKYDREIEDNFFKKLEDDEDNFKIFMIIKKLIQVDDIKRFDSIESLIVSLDILKRGVNR